MASALLRGTCNGYVTLSDKAALTFSSRLKTEYTYRSGPKQQIQLDSKMKYRSMKNLKQYSVDRYVSASAHMRLEQYCKRTVVRWIYIICKISCHDAISIVK